MLALAPEHDEIVVSYLKYLLTNGSLHQSRVTEFDRRTSFGEFVPAFTQMATFARPQASKTETYGWTPTYFDESTNPTTGRTGRYRLGRHSVHQVSLAYLDLDNHHDDRPAIRFEDVHDLLRALGVSHHLYTSFSHAHAKHKVRVIMPIDRWASYEDMWRIAAFLNVRWFETQLDMSIYDDGDFLYGPPRVGRTVTWAEGEALSVSGMAALYGALEPAEQALLPPRRVAATPAAKPLTPAQKAANEARRADLRTQTGLSIKNPRFFNPAWLKDVHGLTCGGSHHQTLYQIMCKVWVKSGGALSYGDMVALCDEVDGEWGGYCARVYGGSVIEAELKKIMRTITAESRMPNIRQN